MTQLIYCNAVLSYITGFLRLRFSCILSILQLTTHVWHISSSVKKIKSVYQTTRGVTINQTVWMERMKLAVVRTFLKCDM